jgi:intein/homing endonuclease
MIVVTTASGKQLRGTPNHPVLTAEGFLPLHKIKPSEHVIYSVTEDAMSIFGNQKVGMKTRIGDLFDSFVNHPGVDISLKRASAQDFYGDGMFMADKIEIAATKSVLRDERDIAASQSVSDMLFRLNNDACRLPTNSGFNHHLLSWFPSVNAAMFKPGAIDTRPNKGLGATGKHFHNVSWPNTTGVHFNNSGAVSVDELVTFAALQSLHDSSLDQKICNASDGTSVLFGQKPGALPIGVFADDVVSVRVEFASEHVFSIESSLGFYTANGLLVKNCSALDGGRWKLDGTPLPGTKLPFRKPPLHWQCRSRLVPITELSDAPGTRSSAIGPISSKIKFEQFMDKQGPAFAAEVLGKGRYEFYKANKLTLSQLIDPRSLEPLTLAELREKFG